MSWRRPAPLQALLVVGLVVIIAGSGLTSYVVGAVIEARFLARDVTYVSESVHIQSAGHFGAAKAGVEPGEAVTRFGADLMEMPGVFRLKVFDASGRIVWSNEPELVGKIFPDNAALARALRGETVAGLVKTTKTEHQYERSVRRVREIYVPIKLAGRAPAGVAEVYMDAAPVEREIRRAQLTIVAISAGAALALYVLLSVAVWRASIALARAKERERLEIDERLRLVERLRAFGEVAAGATHDLANVFAVILGRVDLLLHAAAELPPKVTAALRSMEKATRDGVEIAHRLRQIARAGDEKPFEQVSMRALVEEVMRMTEPRWRKCTGVDVVPVLEAVPPVLGHASELREVLTNLILNALDAMPDGGRLTVSTSTRNGYVLATVADTGTGMPEEVRRKLFTPFFTTKPNGTGLGLSVSYGIVKRHGGDIEVKSEEGKGSWFVVKLPVATSVPAWAASA